MLYNQTCWAEQTQIVRGGVVLNPILRWENVKLCRHACKQFAQQVKEM